jgi:NAD-reducing hydrogenase small subunit
MERIKLATVWLGGCSGCHMSFLDMDEWLIELSQIADLVYSPLADVKEYPQGVDLVLVEGAIANEENFHLARRVRERSKLVVAFGDCAVTGNVTAMRNPCGIGADIVRAVYLIPPENSGPLPSDPEIVPALLDRVLPLHQVVHVDHFLPGCPPSAERIRNAIDEWLGKPSGTTTSNTVRYG